MTQVSTRGVPFFSAAPAQRLLALAADAEARGWIEEADRHHRLIARLDAVMAQAASS